MTRKPATNLFRLADSVDRVCNLTGQAVKEMGLLIEHGNFLPHEVDFLKAWAADLVHLSKKAGGVAAGCRDMAEEALPREREMKRR